MPQNTNATKKKKKGHAPAHQNTFAFKHNPKSKKTQKILESPNIHVCRRCHDKIEWRKQYRKYKPRTQPGKCNGCQKRNVLAAYHTICESCTIHSDKAKEIIQQSTPSDDKKEEEEEKKVANPIDSMETDDDRDQPQQLTRQEELKQKILSISNAGPVVRACAICVKEIALPDPEEEGGEDIMDSMGRMRLRERRTLERQLAAATKEEKNAEDEADGDEKDEESQEEEDLNSDDNDNESDDPFLKAVGGADLLLVGEEYQKKLLERNA